MPGRVHEDGKTDDSAGTGRREYYTVLLEEGALADVMAVYDTEHGERLDTVYVMELEDGGTVYTYESDGNSVGKVNDYGVSERELICFVIHYMDALRTMTLGNYKREQDSREKDGVPDSE